MTDVPNTSLRIGQLCAEIQAFIVNQARRRSFTNAEIIAALEFAKLELAHDMLHAHAMEQQAAAMDIGAEIEKSARKRAEELRG